MPTTVITVESALQTSLKDVAGAFLSEVELTPIIASQADNETTFTLTRLMAGRWNLGSRMPLVLFGPTDEAPGFTEADGCTYRLWLGGSMNSVQLELLTGTDTRTQIRVAGCRVDYNEALIAVLETLMTHRSTSYNQNAGGMGIAPEAGRDVLQRQIEGLRGVRAL